MKGSFSRLTDKMYRWSEEMVVSSAELAAAAVEAAVVSPVAVASTLALVASAVVVASKLTLVVSLGVVAAAVAVAFVSILLVVV